MTSIPRLFDTKLLAYRRARAYATFGNEGEFLLADAAHDMLDRLDIVLRSFPKCAELGGHNGLLARALKSRKGTDSILRMEQHPSFLSNSATGVLFDPECLPLKAQCLNLLVSPLFLQWVNDLPGTLIQIRQSLAPDGLFLATLLGRETLRELREVFLQADSELSGGVSPRVAPLPDIRDMGPLLQRAGFALPVADHDILTVRYASLFDLMKDLRRMGATNILMDRSRTFLRRDTLMRAAELYQEKFSDPDGRIYATFQILSLSGWAPHESQQKPLKPGSAKQSLTAILGDKSSDAES
ncbi:SAM-dependent methyltransferase [Cohaesibacter celericrescens]|uniref:SAM-dependent methyltransferase n=1 Tax=Cohaesibacter celericrescens TaxID=2067669 RepID=UPI00356172F2